MIARLAERQHGTVAYRQLIALGYTRSQIERLIANGWLHPLYKGVYAVGHRALSPQGQWMAAVLACGPTAVLSLATAAALHGIRPSAAAKIDVTVPGTSRHSHGKLRVHRARTLRPGEITEVDGIPVTTVARTLLDLARVVRANPLINAIEAGERRELFDLRAIEQVLAGHPGHPGTRKLRRALTAYQPPPDTRSGYERRILRRVHAAGLPEPHVNTLVAGQNVDLHFPHSRLVVELDGDQYHQSPPPTRERPHQGRDPPAERHRRPPNHRAPRGDRPRRRDRRHHLPRQGQSEPLAPVRMSGRPSS